MLEIEVGFAPQLQLILATFLLRVLNKGRVITSLLLPIAFPPLRLFLGP